MSKNKKPKLGRTFDSIIDDDNEISHKNIFNRFVSEDASEEQNPSPSLTQEEKIPGETRESRRAFNSFIWYESEGNKACSGLGRICEIGDKEIIVETTRYLPPNDSIHIETMQGLKIVPKKAEIINCVYKEKGIYISELKRQTFHYGSLD